MSYQNKVEITSVRNKNGKCQGAVSFEEALNLTGFGKYNIILLCICMNIGLAVGLELLWSTFVVPASACDLELEVEQRGILASVPFMGVIAMSHIWGYLSDLKGRRYILFVSMFCSFVISFASSFSPHWIVLMMFRFVSICFSSASNALMITLVAESCPLQWRGRLTLLVSTALMGLQVANGTLAYLILPLEFRIPIEFLGIVYRPWRLLIQCLSLFNGVGAIAILCMHESPKFLAAHGRNDEALKVLSSIYATNTGDLPENYPVTSLIFDELHDTNQEKMTFLRSIWTQTVPLFKPPLLWNTLRLYYITFSVYLATSSYFVWFSYILNGYFIAIGNDVKNQDLCGLMRSAYSTGNVANETIIHQECNDQINDFTIFTAVGICGVLIFVNVMISFIPQKRTVLMVMVCVGGACGLGTNIVPEPTVALLCFVIFLCIPPAISIAFAYFSELFPTNVRGTASCLGVMVGRTSSFIGSYVIGLVIEQHCAVTFYVTGGLILTCTLVAFTLPVERSRK